MLHRGFAWLLFGALAAIFPATAFGAVPAFTPAMARAIDKLAADELSHNATPGLSIGVVENGLLVYAKGYGVANLQTREGLTPGTEFYVGSVTKEFTAAAVLLLAQNHQLSLGDKVTKYVPELTVAKDVTISQLLQQTSGLPDASKAFKFPADFAKPIRIDAFIKTLDGLPPASPPGAKFAYNNANYMIAALVVARVSGLPFSVFLQTHIFEPLVMTSSFLAGDEGIAANHAVGYRRASGRWARAMRWDPSWLFGSESLVTDVYDLAKWDIALPLLLDVESVGTMWTPSGAPGGVAYGMGWVIDQRSGKRFIWHNGEIAGFHAMNALLPDDHVAVIVLANADSFGNAGTIQPERVANAILDVVDPAQPALFENVVIDRAMEWVGRLQRADLDRTQLTPAFNSYLTDALVQQTNLKAAGSLLSLTPIESFQQNGDTAYVFLARFEHQTYTFQFVLTPQGKIDGLYLKP
jgi:CubicO group peptidase (beta-lactamase class C family)